MLTRSWRFSAIPILRENLAKRSSKRRFDRFQRRCLTSPSFRKGLSVRIGTSSTPANKKNLPNSSNRSLKRSMLTRLLLKMMKGSFLRRKSPYRKKRWKFQPRLLQKLQKFRFSRANTRPNDHAESRARLGHKSPESEHENVQVGKVFQLLVESFQAIGVWTRLPRLFTVHADKDVSVFVAGPAAQFHAMMDASTRLSPPMRVQAPRVLAQSSRSRINRAMLRNSSNTFPYPPYSAIRPGRTAARWPPSAVPCKSTRCSGCIAIAPGCVG